MKKLKILMIAVAILLAGIASWASDPEVMQITPSTETLKPVCEPGTIDFFSKSPENYMLTLHQDVDNNYHFVVYYGKLMDNRYFSDLTKIFSNYGDDYHPNIEEAINQNEDLANQKMLPFFWNTSYVDRTAMPSNCEAIQGGKSFRCTTKKFDTPGGKPFEALIEGYSSTWISFRAADPCIAHTAYWKFTDMLSRGEIDDKDADGVPDSFETPIYTLTKKPSIKETPEEAPAESTAPTDIGEPSVPLTAGEPAAPLPADEVQEDIQIGFDKGGCSLTSAASANPASCILIAAALLALVHRRGK